MKKIKYTFIGLVLIVVCVIVALWVYINYTKPTYQGVVHFSKIRDTKVYYDSIGVPHIFAKNETNSLMALGYVHAQDRWFQMEILRRIAQGRLSEIFGKDLVPTDRFFGSLGIEETVYNQLQLLDKNPKIKKLAMAYLEGINHYIDHGKIPLEFTMLGIEKEHYTLKDMYYVSAYMAFSFAHAFKTDPLVSYMNEYLGSDYLKDLGLDIDIQQQAFKVTDTEELLVIRNVLDKSPFPPFIGSNGWVLNGVKTKNKKVLFANDPHIGFAQPSVWFQAHIKTPHYENYGFYLGLMPFPLLAHNRTYAFGLTMFENDDIDFYQLKPVGKNNYQTANGTYAFKNVTKKIIVKGENPVVYKVRKSHLGYIVNDVMSLLKTKNPIALSWTYQLFPSKVLETTYAINHVNNISSFEKGVSDLSAPGLNFVYGDKNNQIGVWSAGKLYAKSVNTMQVLDAMQKQQLYTQYLTFNRNPKTINPSSGYVATANQVLQTKDGKNYPGYYLPNDRISVIQQSIEVNSQHTVRDMMQLANNVYAPQQVKDLQHCFEVFDLKNMTDYELLVLDNLVKWKGGYQKDAIAPSVYNAFLNELVLLTFKDELDNETYFEDFVQTNLFKNAVHKIFENPNAKWWDNVKTPQKEDFKYIVNKSFKNAVKKLGLKFGEDPNKWQWGKLHQVTFEHPLAKVYFLKKWLNVGPYPISGGNETVSNMMFDFNTDLTYKVTAGPSAKRIIDFSDVENAFGIVPTGQSGHFLSPYYKNLTNTYINGGYVKMLINEKEIKKSKNVLIFQ